MIDEPILRRPRLDRAIVELRCPFRPTTPHQLGSQIGPEGVMVWCKDCRRGHLLSWRELEEARQSLGRPVAFSASVR